MVGVISFGDENCRQYGFDGRVDAALPWLNATLGGWETPSCNADGRCAVGCPQVDEDCVPEGATCTRPEVCESRQCVRDGTNAASYCSKPCQADGDCGRGLECGPVGLCILKPKVPRSTLEACDEYEDLCIGGNLCAGPKDGITRCVNACPTQADCESSTTCETGAGNKRFCRPPESVVRFFPLLVPQAKLTGDTGGGCSSGSGLSTAALWVLLALALGARSKQRHRAD